MTKSVTNSEAITIDLLQPSIHALSKAVVVTDNECCIQTVNQAFNITFGYIEDEIAEQKSSALFPAGADVKQKGFASIHTASRQISEPQAVTFQTKTGRELPGNTVGFQLIKSDN